jgi:hypothetical protein
MKGDFTRLTHDPSKHYSRVLKQQGRVDLDADWNEQVAIERHLDRTKARDVIGPCGAPRKGGGFNIGVWLPKRSISLPERPELWLDLSISAGRFYADGLLCELERGARYRRQPHYPQPAGLAPEFGRTDLVYLDVWERHITAIDDPDIREVALGGPDTTTRLQTVWQVRVLKEVEAATCSDEIKGWPPPRSGGRLTTDVVAADPDEDPCSLAPAGGYQGLENRLYRVEIHDRGDMGEATFKWSRDNGSVVFSVQEFVGGQPTAQVRVKRLGYDQVLALHVGDWVEVLDDGREFASEDLLVGEPGTLAQIIEIDEAERIVTLDRDLSGYDVDKHAKVRRWDQPSQAITVTGDLIELEEGIQIQFSGSDFRTGDYWTFAARTATGGVNSLSDGGLERLNAAPPQGPVHHYCPLALVTWRVTTPKDLSERLRLPELPLPRGRRRWPDEILSPFIRDCRPRFPPLTELTSLYLVGGEGQESMPGDPLPRLLEVRVASGGWVIEGARVRFQTQANGLLAEDAAGLGAAGTSNTFVATTNAEGVASCAWKLDPSGPPSQQVTATLLDADGNPVWDADGNRVHVVRFTANHSVASQVSYEPGKCLKAASTVKEALDQLCRNVSLSYVGGDGQEARPGEWLAQPLQVRVANGGFPIKNATVTFRIAEGEGGLVEGAECRRRRRGIGESVVPITPGEREIHVVTDERGLASCCWRLDKETVSQRTVALLESINGRPVTPRLERIKEQSVAFNANLSQADLVAYSAEKCDHLKGIHTVHEALEKLCELIKATQPGIKVDKVLLRDENGDHFPLKNDTDVQLETLSGGIWIRCENEIAPASVLEKPVCSVTLELPYPPGSGAPSGASNIVGFYLLKLAAHTRVYKEDHHFIVWVPTGQATEWSQEVLKQMPKPRLLAHLTLKGSRIWAEANATLLVDGDTFAEADGNRTAIRLPSGDGQRGGDLEMWFWLVPTQARLDVIEVDATRLSPGRSTLGTVRLTSPAPEGGLEIALSGIDSPALEAPTSVFVPAGETEVTFPIKALAVNVETPVVIKARLGGVERQRTVRVQP